MNQSKTIRGGSQQSRPRSSPVGFTLVEMLISVTLVLLMMVMFGEIFQLATGSVTKQRIMADNDQNLRTFVSVMRADLDRRTFRTLVPFYAGEPLDSTVNPSVAVPSKRRGYFYISNNNIADGTDDVLQFTVEEAPDLPRPYFGHAVPLVSPSPPASASPLRNFVQTEQQPDRDDLEMLTNNAGASHAAEVSYWLRGGRLYRRVMLLRDPVNPDAPVQPTDFSGTNKFFQPTTAFPTSLYPPSANFWTDFDYSAHQLPPILVVPPTTAPHAIFNGLKSLNNGNPLITGTPTAESLGQSWNRFGHNHNILAGNPGNGLPREFSTGVAPNFFIGRLTQEETSTSTFQYPQTTAGGNPMDAAATTFVDANNDSVIDSLANGPRTGVDLLLSNVHEFRVEVWDQRNSDFAPVGHSIGVGDYHILRQLNSTYAPLGGSAHIYDTWHPNFDRNLNNVGATPIPLGDAADRPPFRALNFDPTGVLAPSPVSTNPSGKGPYWTPSTTYFFGDVIFPQPGEDLNFNGFLDPGEDGANGFPVDGNLQENVLFGPTYAPGELTDDANGNGILDPGEDGTLNFPTDGAINKRSLRIPYFPTGLTLAYRCKVQGMSGATRAHEPNWSKSLPADFFDPFGGGPKWEVVYNVRPLRAIRITVRFEHPQSKQMRQITIVHSLRDTTLVP